MPLLRHYENLGMARFVTFSCYHRRQLLVDSRDIHLFLSLLGRVCRRDSVNILAYVVMPEHVHLVLLPPDELPVGKLVGEVKSRSARAILSAWMSREKVVPSDLACVRQGREQFRFWQYRCYDHNCRSPRSTIEKTNYCHNNPVKRGLAAHAADWPWSSYRWYHDLDGIELEIDGFQL